MKADIIGGALGVFVGIAVVGGALQLRIGTPTNPQPGFFPFLGGIAVAVLSGILIVQALMGGSVGGEPLGDVRRPAILVGSLAVYVAVLDPVGYVPATMLLTGTILRVLGVTSWRIVSVAGVALSVGTYVLFARLLDIDLPAGLLKALG
jgi:putative tricarboxylic transport membrane protein